MVQSAHSHLKSDTKTKTISNSGGMVFKGLGTKRDIGTGLTLTITLKLLFVLQTKW